ncbi:MAG: D-alanine--D-alanine ligase [Candidatus Glassbacteria bacterium]|nr:D-alanine--D-alanine ligase [Candidatus Glassbacteria bacterium]
MKVIILAGGDSSEREISLASARCAALALSEGKHRVTVMDPGLGWMVIDPASASSLGRSPARPLPDEDSLGLLAAADIVFSVLHGGPGEDGTIHAVLELLGVPYAGSPVGPSAIAMNKVTSKRLFAAAGVPTPEYLVLEAEDREHWPEVLEHGTGRLGLPLIVKPAAQGSTVGLSKCSNLAQCLKAAELAAGYGPQVVVERFIDGRELTVGILGEVPLPVLEIVVPGGFYDYRAKYQSHDNQYICPARIDPAVSARAQHYALEAFKVLGLKDYSRLDFRLDESGGLWCIEANNQPGMTDSSLFPKAAKVLGLDLRAVLERIIHLALERFQAVKTGTAGKRSPGRDRGA